MCGVVLETQMVQQWYNQVCLGNCIDALNSLDPESARVQLAFADPPYNIGYSYDVYKDNLDDMTYLTFTEQWMGAVNRVLDPMGTLWVAIGDEYVAEVKSIGK